MSNMSTVSSSITKFNWIQVKLSMYFKSYLLFHNIGGFSNEIFKHFVTLKCLGNHLYIMLLVEEIYKTNLEELADILDGDVEAAVKHVRLKAETAIENVVKNDTKPSDKGLKRKY